MSGLFYNCSSLKILPDISKWNTKEVKNISKLFYNCSSLNSLPDISKWNTINIINMSELFSFCSSIKKLPDISKWNTNNVTNMSGLFYSCGSIKDRLLTFCSIIDFSKVNIYNEERLKKFFSDSFILEYFPDISWDNDSKVNISSFDNCSSLESLHDISKWNTNNVTDMSELFSFCSSLKILPDISKWNTNNVIDMSGLFYFCPL